MGAFGKVLCVIEVEVGACGGSWGGEDGLEALKDLLLCLSVVQDLSFGLRDEICYIPLCRSKRGLG